MSNKELTHKELLTFSNATSLAWEFVDLKAIKEGDYDAGQGSMDEISTQLNDLLTPEVFARRDAEKDIEEFVYMKDADTTDIDQLREDDMEQGRIQLRQEAGIAMEFLEKWELEKWEDDDNEEGRFIEDWEVIYGADNYKVVADYLDYKWESLLELIEKLDGEYSDDETDYEELAHDLDSNLEPYPERDEIEEAQNKQEKAANRAAGIDFTIGVKASFLKVSVASVGGFSDVKIGLRPLLKKMGSSIKSIIEATGQNITEEYFASVLTSWIMANALNPSDVLEDSLEAIKDYDSLDNRDSDAQQELEILVENFAKLAKGSTFGDKEVKLTERLDMRDTGFRVLVLENNDGEIVISYQGDRESKEELLPQELDLLQIVYDRIRRDNSDAKITFTGFSRGAELSFVNTLFANSDEANTQAVLFCNPRFDLKKYVYLNQSDLNAEYNSIREINFKDELIDSTLGVVVNLGIAFLALSIIGAPLTLKGIAIFSGMGLLVSIGAKGLNYILSRFSDNTESIYKNLIEAKVIVEKDGVEGQITEGFLKKDYIKLKPKLESDTELKDEFEEIKIKKEHGVYLIINQLSPIAKEVYIKKEDGELKKKTLLFVYTGHPSQEEIWQLKKNEQGIYEIKQNLCLAEGFKPEDYIFSCDDLTSEDKKIIESKVGDKSSQDGDYIKLEPTVNDEIKIASIEDIKENNYNFDLDSLPEGFNEFKEIKLKKEDGAYLKQNNLTPNVEQAYLVKEDGSFKKETLLIVQDLKQQVAWQLKKDAAGLYQIKNKISDQSSQHKSNETFAINNLTSKDRTIINEGNLFSNLLKILADMQDAYQNKKEEIFTFISPVDGGVEVSKEVPKKVAKLDNKDICAINEFIFMPYLSEDGEVDKDLREEYIRSVVKSVIQMEAWKANVKPGEEEKELMEMKYNPELAIEKYDFSGEDVHQQLLDICKRVLADRNSNFNYAKQILERIEDDWEEITDYYEQRRYYQRTRLVFNPEQSGMLEYNYNLADNIFGGGFKLELKSDVDIEAPLYSDIKAMKMIANNKDNALYKIIEKNTGQNLDFLNEIDRVYTHKSEGLEVPEEYLAKSCDLEMKSNLKNKDVTENGRRFFENRLKVHKRKEIYG